ncbi:GTP-binding protein [Pseudalgibacter alginicilyticus]|uniref:GTP-binding protein n=1 Tax=Pseudalgibacter alginicilyticus TaxID=1736674 RepID=A0A0P0CIQ0_9FLAO|nr:hypothetical protein [Pseudalgibacter alginicilyticus]ALJ06073.1 GTP-binding protein [Pseudalgibacter alginicilyticus]
MTLSNDIVLRPRFKFEVSKNNETVLSDFETTKTTQSNFIVNRIDDHVFIMLPKAEQHFWSPQLHLEINEINKNICTVSGLFGPNPTVWTLFMFLHFVIACLFIAFGVWAFTNWNLNQNFTVQLSIMILMVVIWIALYFAGSIGKVSNIKEMKALNDFMYRVLNEQTL